jgi:hypothetical protein
LNIIEQTEYSVKEVVGLILGGWVHCHVVQMGSNENEYPEYKLPLYATRIFLSLEQGDFREDSHEENRIILNIPDREQYEKALESLVRSGLFRGSLKSEASREHYTISQALIELEVKADELGYDSEAYDEWFTRKIEKHWQALIDRDEELLPTVQEELREASYFTITDIPDDVTQRGGVAEQGGVIDTPYSNVTSLSSILSKSTDVPTTYERSECVVDDTSLFVSSLVSLGGSSNGISPILDTSNTDSNETLLKQKRNINETKVEQTETSVKQKRNMNGTSRTSMWRKQKRYTEAACEIEKLKAECLEVDNLDDSGSDKSVHSPFHQRRLKQYSLLERVWNILPAKKPPLTPRYMNEFLSQNGNSVWNVVSQLLSFYHLLYVAPRKSKGKHSLLGYSRTSFQNNNWREQKERKELNNDSK